MAPKKGKGKLLKRSSRMLGNRDLGQAVCKDLTSQPIASGSITGTTWEEIPSRTPSRSESNVDTTTTNVPDKESHELQRDDFKPPVAIPASSPTNDEYSAINATIIRIAGSPSCRISAYSHLVADSREFVFFVSKDTISMSSSVLEEEMIRLQQSFLELERIDIAAFHTILRILHFDIQDSFLDSDFKTFVQIRLLCERFEFHRALRPWMHIWLEKHRNLALDPGYEDWLYISTTLESYPKLEVLISLLSNECSSISECGTYVLRCEKEVLTKNWPENILSRILLLRDEKVKRLTHLLKILTKFFKHTSDPQGYCETELCLNIAYGSLFRSIEKEGLYRLLEPDTEWHGSVEGLREKLNGIKIDSLNQLDFSHECSIQSVRERFMARVAIYSMDVVDAVDLVDTINGLVDANDTESKKGWLPGILDKVPTPKEKGGSPTHPPIFKPRILL